MSSTNPTSLVVATVALVSYKASTQQVLPKFPADLMHANMQTCKCEKRGKDNTLLSIWNMVESGWRCSLIKHISSSLKILWSASRLASVTGIQCHLHGQQCPWPGRDQQWRLQNSLKSLLLTPLPSINRFGETATAASPHLVYLVFLHKVSVYVHTQLSHALNLVTHNHWLIMMSVQPHASYIS